MSQERSPLIMAQGLCVEQGGKRVIDTLSFTTSARRITLLGKNGSGKTTLAKTLCGVIEPQLGTSRICGIDVFHDRAQAIETVGYLFQNADHQIIFPTVEEEIAFGLGNQGLSGAQALEKAHDILHDWGRADWAKRHVSSLSGGQKQLLCLMSILSMSPKVIFLDEPFSGLDIPTRARLGRILDGLDLALVHITHAPQDIQGYDEALWIDEGKIKHHGDCATVCAAYLAAMDSEADA